MCGICGILDFDAPDGELPGRLGAMIDTLRHRGPDAQGRWATRCCALGHARLSIIDLADGAQPMCNEDGSVWITYNGEVYNFPALREDLIARGHRFKSRCDTEVILHLYEELGPACVESLRGMFAFAVWDGRRGEMLLARDRLGIKPLYYTFQGEKLIFGSEIKAILAHGGVNRSVRPDALSDYLTFLYVPAPKTMFEGILKLPAGHWLRVTREGSELRQYWDLPAGEIEDEPARIEQQLRDRIEESVRMRMISDVPLGAFLSGGLDSSAVVAAMAKASSGPVVTASVGFNEEAFNELPHARRVAQRFGTQHHEEIVTPQAAQVLQTLAWHYDEPFGDDSAVPTYYVSQAARRYVTVALSGDGGDENFAGYRRYRFDLAERRLRRMLPGWLRRGLVAPLGDWYPKADWLPRPLRAKVTLQNIADDPAGAYCRSVGFLTDEQKPAFLAPDVTAALAGYRSDDTIRRYMNAAPRGDLQQLLYTDIKTYLAEDILAKVDRASMAVSLEVRVPLLDHKLVEYVHQIPAALKLRRGQGKAIFKSAMAPVLGAETVYRPKQGFTPPVGPWLRGPLKEMAQDLLLCERPAYGEYLRRGAIESAWRQHQAGLRDYTALLYPVLMLELWARRFLQGAGAP